MYKLVVIAMLVVAAQAGYLGGYGYAAAPAVAYASPAVHGPVAYAAPAVHAPLAYAAPTVVKAAVPVATSYANTYKVSVASAPTYVKAAPVAYAAPAHVAYAAPAYAAPTIVKSAYASPLSLGGYYH